MRLHNLISTAETGLPSNGILVDSGCTSHLFGEKSLFTRWDKYFIPGSVEVILADGKVCKNAIIGRGDVLFPTKDINGLTVNIKIENVLYMPTCEYAGIYSVLKGVNSGDKVIFSKGESYLLTSSGTKIPLLPKGNLLFLGATRTKPIANRTSLQWHYILAHLNHDDINKMINMVRGMKVTKVNRKTCIPCIRGKASNRYSRVPDPRSSAPFEFVHTDIAGPFNVPDTSGDARYIIVFVCDYSNFMKVYSL